MDEADRTMFPARGSVHPARGGVRRERLDPAITADQISRMVDTFYDAVLADPRLGPIFETGTTGHWSDHLAKMKMFWRSVLLRSGEYKGKPVQAHQKIDGLDSDTFQRWLSLFAPVCRRIYHPEAAELVIAAAARIATSLWLSRSGDIFAAPPVWSTSPHAAPLTNGGSGKQTRGCVVDRASKAIEAAAEPAPLPPDMSEK